MCKLNLQKKWPHETSFTNESYFITLGLPLNGSSFGIKETGVLNIPFTLTVHHIFKYIRHILTAPRSPDIRHVIQLLDLSIVMA